MEIKNISGNTIYVEDINWHIPYEKDELVHLSPNTLKKSRSLRSLLMTDMVEIVNYNENEQIEKAVVYNKKTLKENPKEILNLEEIAQSTTNDLEVNISGIFYEAGGYGKVNRYLASNLEKLGTKVKISPKNGQNQLNLNELQNIVRLEKTQLSKNHITIDSIIPSFSEVSSGKKKILYTTIEAYSVPDQFIECCKQYHHIWVTSPFAKEVLQPRLKEYKIQIVPTGVAPSIYNENVEPVTFNPKLKNFIFLSVFGWSYRKGYDLLMKAYFKAFTNKDDVSLLLFTRYMQSEHPSNVQKIEDDINKLKPRTNDLPHYKVTSKVVSESLMPQIYRACNAFVLPSRGEGTNIPVCEASLCGLPVISTNVSGHRIYLKHDNSYLIEMDKLEKLQSDVCHVHYWDNQVFPLLKSQKCVNDLAEQMRYVYENYEKAKEKNSNLQRLLLNEFTWQKAAEKAHKKLKELL